MKTISDYEIEKIRDCTRLNGHTEALMCLAISLGAKNIIKSLKGIMQIHDAEGHMPLSILEYRRELYNRLISIAKERLTEENLSQVIASF